MNPNQMDVKISDVNPAIFASLEFLTDYAYKDAVKHGLWEDPTCAPNNPNGMKYVRRRCLLRIREELSEACEAAHNPEHFAEELADVVIMCMSVSGHLGIDLAEEVRRKMAINHERPYGHKSA